MTTTVLVGADDVRSAGYVIERAAGEMKAAAASFEAVFARHQQFMGEWLQRFEEVLRSSADPGTPAEPR